MVTCELDNEVSGELMGWKLPAWQALLLHRVLPSCGGLVVYVTLMCYDFTIICEHFINGDEGIGVFCTILMVLPSLISLVFTLASPPPGLQTELSAFAVTIEKNEIRWLVIQFVNAIFFPVVAIGRYCYLIFWWVEAVCASRSEDKERTQDAIIKARAPSPAELYLFLQSFLHAAPLAIVNILDLMTRYSDMTFDKVSVQAVSIIASSLRMASTATMYRRFEREKLSGRKYPWGKMEEPLIDTDDSNNNNEDVEKANAPDEENNIYESISKKASILSDNSTDSRYRNTNSDMIQFSPRNTVQNVEMSSAFFDNEVVTDSDSSDYLPPNSPSRNTRSLDSNSDDEYIRPVSIIDSVAPLRRNTEYTIEKVEILPPPVMLAPRPLSLAVWAERMVENAESIPGWLSAPPRRKYCDEVVQDEPDIPRRVPRSYIRGLEPQDATAALVHFLGWYLFFVARLLSIACFITFFPVLAIIILFSHYQAMLLFLIVPQAPTVKRGFYVFLAFIYLFCLMEFKIRFRHVRVWHVFWIIVCTIETVVFTGLWASIGNNMHEWWKYYIVKVIITSILLSYMCFLVYFVLLQPRETVVYIKNKKNNVTKYS